MVSRLELSLLSLILIILVMNVLKKGGELNNVERYKKGPTNSICGWQAGEYFFKGVTHKKISNIITRNGVTTELYRPEWAIGPDQVRHIIHVILRANTISAWHVHEYQTDTIFVTSGSIKLVLFDTALIQPHG
ncbi:hypothetical protein [Nitrosomonas sp. Nm166]|uniref:hypothetical protein n=1 Tax=Nitrosomonas sp. Nm166 TaxID=1881054 RepID=UPI0008E2C4A1|nr:hypothetical protein [Nitrosomonas sp. Nm166]SFE22363.1 hypothetical protein SAMN05428977_10106 [Nitrosomonas sp. Nm166]